MRRDKRLLIAMLLFTGSLLACVIQAGITAAYINAAVMGDWTWFAETFSVDAPAHGPIEFCFGYCTPQFPLLAGWIGLAFFSVGWIILAYAWWKPRA